LGLTEPRVRTLAVLGELGREIEVQWLDAGYSEARFPEIAAAALSRFPLEAFDPDETIRWALSTHELPHQHDPDANFGNPPLTVFSGRAFIIDLLFWVDSTTSVHQHSFSGAFRVATGSSLHRELSFEVTERLSSHLALGVLTQRSVERLTAGNTRPIRAGEGFIHSLFHLDRPSITIVVRTREDRDRLPQFEYHPPGLAVDPFHQPAWLKRQMQVLNLLVTIEHKEFDTLFRSTLEKADPFSAYRLLSSIRRRIGVPLFEDFIGVVTRKDPRLGTAFGAAFEQDRASEFLTDKRRQVWDADLRYFLALLLNLRSREEILRMAASYRPNVDPVDSILGWVEGLGAMKASVEFKGAAWQPNLFGIPPFGDEDRANFRSWLTAGSLPMVLTPAMVAMRKLRAFAPLFAV